MTRSRVWLALATTLTLLTIPAAPAAAGATGSTWTARPSLHHARFGATVTTMDGTIFVFGGGVIGGSSVAVPESRRTAGDGRWHDLAPMRPGRGNAASAGLDGSVYVAGGYTDDSDLASAIVERYDVRTDSWQSATALPRGRGGPAAATLGGRIYLAGGVYPIDADTEEVTGDALVYDTHSRTWTAIAPMPTPRGVLKMVAAGGRLYAVGGLDRDFNATNAVERYDPRTGRWTALTPMNEARRAPGLTVVERGGDTLIVAAGGCPTAGGTLLGFQSSTEVYSVRTGRWHTLAAQLPGGRCSLAAATAADGSVLAIGGATDFVNKITSAEVLSLKL
jgi:N-acetylneuraminic acid mutarotase